MQNVFVNILNSFKTPDNAAYLFTEFYLHFFIHIFASERRLVNLIAVKTSEKKVSIICLKKCDSKVAEQSKI